MCIPIFFEEAMREKRGGSSVLEMPRGSLRRVSHCLLVKRRRVSDLSLTWSDWFLRARSGPIYSDEFGLRP